MGYILEFRSERDKDELIEKMHKAKKAVCDALESLEDSEDMSERGRYRDDRRMRMRDDWENTRNGRYSY